MEKNKIYNGSTPIIDSDSINEIMMMNIENLGGGIIRFPNVVDIDKEKVIPWIDENALSAHQQRWTYHTDEEGNRYATNEDGNKFAVEQIEEVPVRVLQPVTHDTEPEMVETFRSWEDAIYKCLIRYIDEFPMVLGTLWWRTRGHVIRYDEGDYLGIHNDNDSNFRSTNGQRYVPRGQAQIRQVVAVLLYINDCVSEEEYDQSNYVGGELFFPYLNVETKPKTGDIFIFPTNYIATHGVKTVVNGKRYCYLEFWSQGSAQEETLVFIREPEDSISWCEPHWVDSIFDDYKRYCLHSEYGKNQVDLTKKPNPIYQNRTLEGDAGLKKKYNPLDVVGDNENRGKVVPS
jgi:hypothetical protein